MPASQDIVNKMIRRNKAEAYITKCARQGMPAVILYRLQAECNMGASVQRLQSIVKSCQC